MSEIKQFKLTNGDELVCEVVEWPSDSEDEDSADIVVRNAYKIISIEGDGEGNRYYGFRPWMIYQQDPDMFQLINNYHVVGEANPSAKVMEYYLSAIKAENVNNEDINARINEHLAKLKAMIESAAGSVVESIELGGDSDSNKIITFPGRRLH